MNAIRKLACILGSTLALLAAGLATHAAPAPHVLLVVGDSLSAGYGLDRDHGWVALLGQRLQQRGGAPWRVVNASISGDTTAGGLSRLPALLQRDHPQVVILELGANDALRGLSLGAAQDNLRRMAAAARRQGAQVLLLGMRLPPNYGAVYAGRFAALYPTVAKAEGASLVPFLFSGFIDQHPDWFQADGLHPVAQAQGAMLDTVWPALLPLLQRAEARRR